MVNIHAVMRLLVISNDFPPTVGGIENYVFSLVQRWPASDVVVLTRWMPGCNKFDASVGFEIRREPVGTLLPTPGLFSRAKSLCKERGIDAVHFPSCLPLGLMGARLEVPYAVSVHGGEFLLASRLPAARQALRYVCSRAAVLMPESSFAEKLLDRFVGPVNPVERITCGVDPDRYGRGQRAESRQGREGPVVVSVSRLIARKGQATLLASLPRLLKSHPALQLLIVGGGPQLPKLEALAARLGVLRSVSFTGPQPWEAIPGYLSQGDVFALPTRARFGGTETEGLPLVVLEAAASALPAVAGNVGGIPDAVRQGETGLLVDGSSIDETGSAVLSLLDDPAVAARMGARARQMVLEEFTWDRVAQRYRTAFLAWCS